MLLPPPNAVNPLKNRISGGCNWTQYNVLQLKIASQLRIISKIENFRSGGRERKPPSDVFFNMTFSLAQGG